ncbi:MAG TPA: hypothetical protein VK116_12905, partial [Planctomycetota bacterium]|nr:hypothetical protein [Planctomycetota bacterium]
MMLKKARSLALIAGWLLASCTSLPDMSKEHLAAARQAREKGELEPALRALTDAVNSASELSFFFTEALLERGDLYLELWESRTGVSETERLELLANAQADYQAVATWDRPEPLDRARALEGHGRVHLRRGAPAEAMRLFREVLAIRGATEEANDPLREVHLSVHRQLGWIILNESLHRLPLDGKPPAAELDVLREAQEHFYAGLEISRDDPLSNL